MSIVTVTTEQVHELIQQLAAQTVAASITPEMVANILENMRQLNDQERLKVIAVAEEYIAEILGTDVQAENVEYRNANVYEKLDEIFVGNAEWKEITLSASSIVNGIIQEDGDSIAYGNHYIFFVRAENTKFLLSHIYSGSAHILNYAYYKVPTGTTVSREVLITNNWITSAPYSTQATVENVRLNAISPISGYDVYLCITIRSTTNPSTAITGDTLSLKKEVVDPSLSLVEKVAALQTKSAALEEQMEDVQGAVDGISEHDEYQSVSVDGYILGRILTSTGDTTTYGNHYIAYRKVSNGEKVKLTHHYSGTASIMNYAYYKISGAPTKDNIISTNWLFDAPYSTSKNDIDNLELTSPSVESGDIYLCITIRSTTNPTTEITGDTLFLKTLVHIPSIEEQLEDIQEQLENIEEELPQIGTVRPFEGLGVYCAGDSNTMYGYYINELIANTGMTLIGSTASSGNGASSTALYDILKTLDSNNQISWANINLFVIFVGGNDYDQNIQEGDTYDYTDYVGDNITPTTRRGAIKAIIDFVQSKAADVNNSNMLICAFSRPERDNFLTTSVSKLTTLLTNVTSIKYSGTPRNAVSEDYSGLEGIAVAEYDSQGSFESVKLSANNSGYVERVIQCDSSKKYRIAYQYWGNYQSANIVVTFGDGTSITLTKDTTENIETNYQWMLSDGTLVKKNNYYNGRRNEAGDTMADIGSQILDTVRRKGFPAFDIHSLCGVSMANLYTWIPDGTHYSQDLGAKIGRLMANCINTLQPYGTH